jgi:hypothetical protein
MGISGKLRKNDLDKWEIVDDGGRPKRWHHSACIASRPVNGPRATIKAPVAATFV